jgi:glycosyltransferase involved in cell wall biosynthesis
MKIFALTNGDPSCASTLYRLLQFRPLMEEAGIEFQYAPAATFTDYPSLATADVVVLQKFLLDQEQMHRIREHSRRLVYDIDDTIWHSPSGQPHAWITRQRKLQQLRATAELCDLCIAANYIIANDLDDAGARRIRVLPMALDEDHWFRHLRADERLTIGWTGSPGNLRYLDSIRAGLILAQSRHPEVRFCVHSGEFPELKGLDFDYLPFVPASEPETVSQFDIGLIPLPDEPFSRGKSPIKALQYFACGVAVIGQPVGATGELMLDEMNSLFIGPNRIWEDAICLLIENATLRRELAETGHRQFQHHHTTRQIFPRLIELIRSG